jgi:hypothetical protein
LAGRLCGLVIRLSDRMPADTAGWVHHVTEVGAYALALEDLAAILAHGKTTITDEERPDMLALGRGMTLRQNSQTCSGHARAQARITARAADRPRHAGAPVKNMSTTRGELMSAESSLTAVAVVRALLNEDTEGLAVLLPDGLPEPGRELMASLASLTVLSAKVAAQAEGIAEGEYLDRIIRLWTDGPRLYRADNGRAARGSSVTQHGDVDPMRADPGSASGRRCSAHGSGSTAAVVKSWTRRAQASSSTSSASRLPNW